MSDPKTESISLTSDEALSETTSESTPEELLQDEPVLMIQPNSENFTSSTIKTSLPKKCIEAESIETDSEEQLVGSPTAKPLVKECIDDETDGTVNLETPAAQIVKEEVTFDKTSSTQEETIEEAIPELLQEDTPPETSKPIHKSLPTIAPSALAKWTLFEQEANQRAKTACIPGAKQPKPGAKIITSPLREWLNTQLARVAENDPKLIELQIDDTQKLNFGPAQQEQLGKALAGNSHLKRLTMSGLNVGTVAALAIAESLKLNQTLEYLNLEDNCIQPNGIRAFADVLAVNKVITELKLARQLHKQGSQAETAFQVALLKNETLTKLTMIIQDKGCKNNIERYLNRNVELARKRRLAKQKEATAEA